MRLFLAFDIPKELKKEILIIQKKISVYRHAKPVRAENLHVTLKFLGEVKDLRKIISELETIKFEAFNMTSSGIGFFPNENFIKIAWIGFEECKELLALQKRIDEKISKDFKRDFKFIPHLTIVRMKTIFPDKNNIIKGVKKNVKSVVFKVNSFKLMKTDLTSDRPIYETIQEFKGESL